MKRRNGVLGLMMVLALVAGACGRSGSDSAPEEGGGTPTTAAGNEACDGVTLEATDTGVTADTITIQVMADTGSPLAPGLFQGNIDALKGFEKYINDNGGIGCRKLKVETWDSKLDPAESKNGQITACSSALAMVGGNSLFNPDVTEMDTCADANGQPTGLANIAALANDVVELCAKNSFTIQGTAETCPAAGGTPTGVRPMLAFVGMIPYYQTIEPDLKGLYLIPADLPTTIQSAPPAIAAQAAAGVEWIGAFKTSGRDEQAAYTPRVQAGANGDATYVYNGSNDAVMINMRREAAAQGLNTVKVWACSLSCYSDKFKAAGADVDGTYLNFPFLPFEDKGSNQELDNYLGSVAKPDSFGAQAWMAAVLFQDAINEVVDSDGPNGITRASVLKALNGISTFDANGWMGPKNPKSGMSECTVIMQLNGSEFERVKPTEKGTLFCDPANVTSVDMDVAVEASKIQ